MNKIWMKTEFKRAVVTLPAILKKAVLLLLVCSMAAGAAAFCATAHDADASRMRLGYVASDNALTDMVVAYVQEIESVKELCSIERVSDEEEGLRLLQEGELAVLAVLPDDIVGEILTGSNAPVTVYMGADNALGNGSYANVKSLLFQELADAAVGMLETAQAEIYAVPYILGGELFADVELVQSLYDDINRFNLITVTGREELFRTKTVSMTENDTYVIYYGSALLTLYLLFVGVFLRDFFCRSDLWENILEKRFGISRSWQVICGFLAGLLPMAVTGFLPFVALVVPYVGGHFHVVPSWSMACLMLLATVLGVMYFMLIYRALGEGRNALLAIGILTVIQGYLSGCLVPSALLPDLVYGVGKYLPAAYVKSAFTVILSGDAQRLSSAVSGLLVWSIVLFAANLAKAYSNVPHYDRASKWAKLSKSGAVRVPPVILVLLKRMLLRRGVLVSLALMAAISVFIARLEEKSDTTLYAAVFDESGEYEKLLCAHEGFARFQVCESADEVAELVLRGKAECGYVLPQDLTKDLAALRANRTVTVYEGVDSVCVPLVNEVLFNAIFRHASLAWYEDYMSEFGRDSAFAQKTIARQIELGKTFAIEFVMVGKNGAAAPAVGNKRTYPVLTVVAAAVILCGVQGLLTAMDDSRRGRFYKRGRIKLMVLTIALPMLAAGVLGGALLLWL